MCWLERNTASRGRSGVPVSCGVKWAGDGRQGGRHGQPAGIPTSCLHCTLERVQHMCRCCCSYKTQGPIMQEQFDCQSNCIALNCLPWRHAALCRVAGCCCFYQAGRWPHLLAKPQMPLLRARLAVHSLGLHACNQCTACGRRGRPQRTPSWWCGPDLLVAVAIWARQNALTNTAGSHTRREHCADAAGCQRCLHGARGHNRAGNKRLLSCSCRASSNRARNVRIKDSV